MAQVMLGKKKGGGSFKLDEFVPDYCRAKPKFESIDDKADEIARMFAEFVTP